MIQSWIFWAVAASSCLAYWLMPLRWRSAFLIAVSVGYLASLDPMSVVMLVGLSTLVYMGAPMLAEGRPKRVRVLVALLLIVVVFLAVFKYVPPLLKALTIESPISALLIPLGISYYCFKLMHFTIEASRGTVERGRADTFFLYMFWFPIFTAGPIERYDHFVEHRTDRLTREDFAAGAQRVIVGVIKQAVIADLVLKAIYPMVPNVAAFLIKFDQLPTHAVWLIALRTYLYVYIGFSAYSDIAIGISRLFGFRIQENFNWPVLARSASDYWQRWHMTLSSWCQNYVYMPSLGQTRNPYLALQLSFFVMGMWHAGTATRLLWGIYHAVAVGVYMTWSRTRRRRKWNFMERGLGIALAILLTQAYVIGSWAILFGEEAGSVYQGVRVLARLFFIHLPAP